MLTKLKDTYNSYVREGSKDEQLVLLSVASIFLPFFVTAAVLFCVIVRALCKSETRKMIFSGFDIKLVAAFALINVVTPFVFKNYLGVACFVGFVFLMLFSLYVRAVLNERFFEKIANTIAATSIVAAFFSTFISDPRHTMRSPSFFFNPNYYGAVITFVILLCTYRLLSQKQNRALYVVSIVANLYGIWQADSQSALISCAFGVLLLLLFTKRYKTLAVVAALGILVALAIIFVPELEFLLPRIKDAAGNISRRADIWKIGIKGFCENFLFGRGALGYLQIYEKFGGIRNFHSHNLFIDLLLSFGVVGIFPLLAFIFRHVKKAFKNRYSPLFFATLGAVLLHSLTDVTLIWIQTGALAALFISFPYIKEQNND